MARTPWWDIPHEAWVTPMMIPYPYDWVAGWKEEHKVELSKEAEESLIAWLERLDQLDREKQAERPYSHR